MPAPASPFIRATVCGGLAAGVLDGLDAVIFFGSRGSSVGGIFQFIASGVLGRSAFAGGASTIALGVALHFLIALSLAAGFSALARFSPWLRRHWIIAGAAFGVIAYSGMTYVVVPLSAAPPAGGFSLPVLLNGIFAHVCLVGWPIAWFARRATRGPATD